MKKRDSLKFKFVLFIGLLVIFVCILLSGFFIRQMKKTLSMELIKRGQILAKNLAYNSKYAVITEDKVVLEQLTHGIINLEDVSYVSIKDKEGVLLIEKGLLLDKKTTPEYDITVKIMSTGTVKNIFPFEAIEPANILRGYTRIVLNTVHLNKKISSLLNIVLLITTVTILLGIGITLLFARLLIDPIKRLVLVALDISKGNFNQTISVAAKGEIGQLAVSFNQMVLSLIDRDKKINKVQSDLKLANIHLEEKVKIRTKDLEGALERLKELDKLKSDFVSNVSHELRTPLTSIKGYIDNILGGITGNISDKQRNYLNSVKRNTDRLVRLINDVLDLAKIESGKINIDMLELRLNNVAKETIESLNPLAREKGINLILENIQPVIIILGNKDRLSQVFINLIHNSIKFTPENGDITIILSSENNNAQVSIKDTGIGIESSELTDIFDKFYQSRSRYGNTGTGLGLTIAKNIIELHKGSIWVESKKGEGTVFSFTIPLSVKK